MTYRLGVDVGGTFTDLLLVDEDTGDTHRAKTPSTPADQSVGVLVGIDKVCALAGIEPAQMTTSCTAPPWRPTPYWRARAPASGWS
jgi:N-methylhydantoinase A